MAQEFKEVAAQDFMTFSREPPPHVLIEALVIKIGGGGNQGIAYKAEVLNIAGWKYRALTSYGAHADAAAAAFNNVRLVLMETEDPHEIIAGLNKLVPAAK